MTRHRLDWFSLLSGLTLTAIAVVALTGIDWDVARWVGPSVLIGVGVLVLAAVVSSTREEALPAASDDAAATSDVAPADTSQEDPFDDPIA